MTGSPLPLLAANGLEALVGLGILLAAGLADTRGSLLARLGLAYGIGLAVTGILGTELALAGVVLGLPELAALAAASLAAGSRRFPRRPASGSKRLTAGGVVAATVGVTTAALCTVTAASFAVRPLLDWDGWAIWGTKAQALYEFGSANSPVFTSSAYAGAQQSYPLLLPALEAVDYRAMGAADGAVVHLQLALLAVAFAGSLIGLLWRRAPIELTAFTALAILAAPPVLAQLGSNYADVPLAFFVALGVVALAAWLLDDDPRMLGLSAIFLAAGTLTKNEGTLFAAAALVPLLVALALRDRRRTLPLGTAAVLVAAVAIPWRIFVAAHHLGDRDTRLGEATHPLALARDADRVWPTVHALLHQVGVTRFGLLVPLISAALATALTSGRATLARSTVGWLAISFGGLLFVYWSSPQPLDWYLPTSAYRVVDTPVVAAAALVPLLAAKGWESMKLLLAPRPAPDADVRRRPQYEV